MIPDLDGSQSRERGAFWNPLERWSIAIMEHLTSWLHHELNRCSNLPGFFSSLLMMNRVRVHNTNGSVKNNSHYDYLSSCQQDKNELDANIDHWIQPPPVCVSYQLALLWLVLMKMSSSLDPEAPRSLIDNRRLCHRMNECSMRRSFSLTWVLWPGAFRHCGSLRPLLWSIAVEQTASRIVMDRLAANTGTMPYDDKTQLTTSRRWSWEVLTNIWDKRIRRWIVGSLGKDGPSFVWITIIERAFNIYKFCIRFCQIQPMFWT